MIYPHSIAFCPIEKEVFISDKWSHRIFVFAHTGEFRREMCTKGDGPGCLRAPEGISVDGNDIWVCDTGNDRIQVGRVLIRIYRVLKSDTFDSGYRRTTEPLPVSSDRLRVDKHRAICMNLHRSHYIRRSCTFWIMRAV